MAALVSPQQHTSDIRTIKDWRIEIRTSPAGAPPGVPSSIKVTDISAAAAAVAAAAQEGAPELVYQIQYIKGVAYPAWCPEQRWARLQSLPLRSDDVLVVSYPKCGTTWAEQCILLLQTRCDVSKINPASKNVYCPGQGHAGKIWPEACVEQNPQVHLKTGLEFVPISQADFDTAPAPRTIKSHAPPHLLLTGMGCTTGTGTGPEHTAASPLDLLPAATKLLVVTRNPLDACVSSYYHAWNPAKSGWPFSAWAAAWLSGNVPHGCWFQWVRAWKQESARHPDRILWVQFEDLKADPVATVRRVAQW